MKRVGSALVRHTGQLEGEDTMASVTMFVNHVVVKQYAVLMINRVPNFPESVIDGLEKIWI